MTQIESNWVKERVNKWVKECAELGLWEWGMWAYFNNDFHRMLAHTTSLPDCSWERKWVLDVNYFSPLFIIELKVWQESNMFKWLWFYFLFFFKLHVVAPMAICFYTAIKVMNRTNSTSQMNSFVTWKPPPIFYRPLPKALKTLIAWAIIKTEQLHGNTFQSSPRERDY